MLKEDDVWGKFFSNKIIVTNLVPRAFPLKNSLCTAAPPLKNIGKELLSDFGGRGFILTPVSQGSPSSFLSRPVA